MNPDHIILTESEKRSLFDNFDLDDQTSQSEDSNEPGPIRQRILPCDYRPISEEEEYDEKYDNQENDLLLFFLINLTKVIKIII